MVFLHLHFIFISKFFPLQLYHDLEGLFVLLEASLFMIISLIYKIVRNLILMEWDICFFVSWNARVCFFHGVIKLPKALIMWKFLAIKNIFKYFDLFKHFLPIIIFQANAFLLHHFNDLSHAMRLFRKPHFFLYTQPLGIVR